MKIGVMDISDEYWQNADEAERDQIRQLAERSTAKHEALVTRPAPPEEITSCRIVGGDKDGEYHDTVWPVGYPVADDEPQLLAMIGGSAYRYAVQDGDRCLVRVEDDTV